MQELETVKEIAGLLLQLGAEQSSDSISCSVFFRRNGTKYGLEFVRDLFAVRLGSDGDGRLVYRMSPGSGVRIIRVLPFWSGEADLERREFPTAFWDSMWRMARRLRECVFEPAVVDDMDTTLELLVEVRRRHSLKPTRETLSLQRMLEGFLNAETRKIKQKIKQENAKKRVYYERLLQISETVPHSLNVARSIFPDLRVIRVAPGYWCVGTNDGDMTGWGIDPVDAAWDLLWKAGVKV